MTENDKSLASVMKDFTMLEVWYFEMDGCMEEINDLQQTRKPV